MKFAIIGSGCGGLFLSTLLKLKNKNDEIIVIDKNKIVGRKLYVTGNGRCNLTNLDIEKNSYNNEFAFSCVKKYDQKCFIKFLNSIGIETRNISNLVYPYSLSAKSFTDYLITFAKKIGVKFINDEKVLDYKFNNKFINVKTDKNSYTVDKLFVSTGGKSSKNLGSDGNFFELLTKHGYKIKSIKPGLTPIVTKEKTSSILNERVKANASLFVNNRKIYEEDGEVIFKKDGLSGICIFNISSLIARNNYNDAKIILDIYPELNEKELFVKLKNYYDKKIDLINGIYSKKISDYILTRCKISKIDSKNISNISHVIKNLEFNYKSNYSFDDSQVSVGGVLLENVKNNLESRIEKNVFFLGEVLDLDGLCGGYNIQLCFSEAKNIVDNLV